MVSPLPCAGLGPGELLFVVEGSVRDERGWDLFGSLGPTERAAHLPVLRLDLWGFEKTRQRSHRLVVEGLEVCFRPVEMAEGPGLPPLGR